MFVISPVDDILDRLVSTNVASDSAADYDATTTYVTGDICKVSSEGTVYKCIADSVTINSVSVSVTGLNPPDYLVSNDATYPWMELRSINYMTMFDSYINTQTQSDDGDGRIEVVLKAGNCDSVALLNVAAQEVSIVVYDNRGSVFYEETQTMYSIVSTLEDYFFTDVDYKNKVVFTFGVGLGGTIKITISNPGGTAKCGMCVIGRKKYIGTTKDEVELPITDYSAYKTDSLGRTKLAVGYYADICNFTIYMTEDRTGLAFWQVRDFLIGLRGKVCVWCVDNTDKTWNSNPALMICGYFTDIAPTYRMGMPTCDIKLTGVV